MAVRIIENRGLVVLAFSALVLASCQLASGTAPQSAKSEDAAMSAQAKAGFGLSEALCSGCHAIAADQVSPNPESPTFETIANTGGLSLATLKDFLRDSHNFPEKMNFEVVDEDVDNLASYIITLRRESYSPPIQ